MADHDATAVSGSSTLDPRSSIPPSPWLAAAGVATAGLGLALGVSDWVFADVYRQEAGRIMAKLVPDRAVWFVGHWGWQYYAERAGFEAWDARWRDAPAKAMRRC